MGVQGFESYLTTHYNIEQTDFKHILNQIQQGLVLDGGSFLHYMMAQCGPSFYLYGFDPTSFIQETTNFLDTLIKKLNIRLIVLLDGVSSSGKESSLHGRHSRRRKAISKIYQEQNMKLKLSCAFDTQSLKYHTFGIPLAKQVFAQCLNTYRDNLDNDDMLRVIQLVDEADVEVAKCCICEQFFGVMGSDSDYFIFNVPNYIPFFSLRFIEDTVYGKVYQPSAIAKHLSSVPLFSDAISIQRPIDQKTLCDFSCLVGNDFFNLKAVNDRMKEYLLSETSSEYKDYLDKITKVETAALFIMTHKDIVMDQNGFFDHSNEQFCEHVFPKQVIKSGRQKGNCDNFI
jgi:hypothetical protein